MFQVKTHYGLKPVNKFISQHNFFFNSLLLVNFFYISTIVHNKNKVITSRKICNATKKFSTSGICYAYITWYKKGSINSNV